MSPYLLHTKTRLQEGGVRLGSYILRGFILRGSCFVRVFSGEGGVRRRPPYTRDTSRACSYKACSTTSYPPPRVVSPSPLPAPSPFSFFLPPPERGNSSPRIVRHAGNCWAVLSPGGERPVGYPTRGRNPAPVLARPVVQHRTLPLESFLLPRCPPRLLSDSPSRLLAPPSPLGREFDSL